MAKVLEKENEIKRDSRELFKILKTIVMEILDEMSIEYKIQHEGWKYIIIATYNSPNILDIKTHLINKLKENNFEIEEKERK